MVENLEEFFSLLWSAQNEHVYIYWMGEKERENKMK